MDNFPVIRLLIGPPGSGKTSYCEQHKTASIIHLSSDQYRQKLLGDITDQSNNDLIFYQMNKDALNFIEKGFSILYDATNINRKSRAKILEKLPNYVQKEAIICWAPPQTCILRDSKRDRKVGEEVINKMLKNFQAPYFDEGFDRIFTSTSSDYKFSWFDYNIVQKDISQQNEHHQHSLQTHMKLAEKYIKEMTIDKELEYAARFHDIGKFFTKTFSDRKGNKDSQAHYYGHQGYGAWIIYGAPFATTRIAWLISTHMDPYLNTKYYNRLPEFLKKQIDLLHEADVKAH